MIFVMENIFKLSIILVSLLIISCDDAPSPTDFKTLSKKATILAFGDSLTAGKGAHHSQSYPAILQQLSHTKVINAGISGEVSDRGLARLPGLLKKYQPELVIICHGGNDIIQHKNLKQTKKNIIEMIQLAQSYSAQVLLLAVPKPTLLVSPAEFYFDIAEATSTAFDKHTISTVLRDRNLKSDTYHPNAKGYAIIARNIFSQLSNSGAFN